MTTDANVPLRAGASFGVGSLPHRSVSQALDFVWKSTDIPTIPSLPRRSPAEGMIAQALVGIEGVSVGQYGGISVDVSALDVDHFITTDLSSDAYGAFAAFLETFPVRNKGAKAVKWQFVGPVTLGMALVRIGLEASIAFPLALQAVREHVSALEEEVRRATGGLTQIIVLDEPLLDEALELGFHIGSEEVIDLISGALAAVSRDNINGLHCCAHTNWRAMLSTGASVLSVPVPSVANNEDSSERSWKALMDVMCSLVNAGVDPVLLRRMSYVTPACGLATHSDAVAEQVFAQVRNIATKVGEQATASRLTLGS